MLHFVPQSALDPEDKKILKAIGFHPAPVKPKLCPQFRSHLPGYVLWFIGEAEARQLLDNLRQATLFAKLLRRHPDFFKGRGPNEVPFFPADAPEALQPEQLAWHTLTLTPYATDPPVDPQSFKDLPTWRRLPRRTGSVWELDAFFASAPMMRYPRPSWSRLGLAADAHSGITLGVRAVEAHQTLSDAAGACLAQALEGQGFRPATLQVKSDHFLRTLAPLAEALEITIALLDRLPMIEQAREHLKELLGE